MSAPLLDKVAIRESIDLLQIIGRDTRLRKVSMTAGGEWHGSCPFCGGRDRFRVQPKHPGGGRWACRQCHEQLADIYAYFEKRDGLTFYQALKKVADMVGTIPATQSQKSAVDAIESISYDDIDRTLWTAAAEAKLAEAIAALWSDDGHEMQRYLHKRGLFDETIKRAELGCILEKHTQKGTSWGVPPPRDVVLFDGLLIPRRDAEGRLQALKIRSERLPNRYMIVTGGHNGVYGVDTLPGAEVAFVVEGELDARLLCQLAPGVAAVSIPANHHLTAEVLEACRDKVLIIAHDSDEVGRVSSARLMHEIPGAHLAPPLPPGYKDLTELATGAGAIIAIAWITSAIEQAQREQEGEAI